MKTYSVLFAQDVPHYGTAHIEAEDDAAALEAAKAFDLSDVTNDPEWENSVCKRIVSLDDPEGNTIINDVPLDNYDLRHGGDKERALCDAAQDMFDALEAAEAQLSMYCIADDGRDTEAHQVLQQMRAAVAKAKGGAK
jgi:hypothetical protein